MSYMTNSKVSVTHVTTACTILSIDGVNFLTDPVFDPAGTGYSSPEVFEKLLKKKGLDAADVPIPPGPHLQSDKDPALKLENLPPVDAILLSHEDHADNLDTNGRQLIDGRRVYTTMDGAKNLSPRPGVVGLKPWETVNTRIGGKEFKITGTPCDHIPGGEVTGFILEADSFGVNKESGLPNAIYISGDTVYIKELAEISKKWHISYAFLNLGDAAVPLPSGPLNITMDGKQAAQLIRDIKPDVVLPLHFESWGHFREGKDEAQTALQEEGLADKVTWLVPGETTEL